MPSILDYPASTRGAAAQRRDDYGRQATHGSPTDWPDEELLATFGGDREALPARYQTPQIDRATDVNLAATAAATDSQLCAWCDISTAGLSNGDIEDLGQLALADGASWNPTDARQIIAEYEYRTATDSERDAAYLHCAARCLEDYQFSLTRRLFDAQPSVTRHHHLTQAVP